MEWKPDKNIDEFDIYLVLGNFLSGMETVYCALADVYIRILGNFLSGMETVRREERVPFLRYVPWKLP